jgi:uncharacterized membrane protein
MEDKQVAEVAERELTRLRAARLHPYPQSLLLALAVHIPRLRSRRFVLIALAAALYIGGGFMATFLVNVPMNEELARVGEVGPAALAQVRAEYEGPWNFWNGVRTVFSSLAFVALIGACLSRSE